MKKIIAIPYNNRSSTMERVVEAIRTATASGTWRVVVSCEPGEPSARSCIRAFGNMLECVHVNPYRMGVDLNTFNAAAIANSAGADLTLYCEDDITIGLDALVMCEHFASRSHNPSKEIVALRRWEEDKTKPCALNVAANGLLGDGFAWSRPAWEWLRRWWLYYDEELPHVGWDWCLEAMMSRHGMKQWRPFVNRSQNIGIGSGVTDSSYNPHHHSAIDQLCCSDFLFI